MAGMRFAWTSLFVLALFTGCADNGDDDGGGGDDDTGDTGDGNTGDACGGFAGLQCDDGYYCDWADDTCGAVDGQGTCQPVPDVCTAGGAIVCGCDGEQYASACAAAQNGTDVSTDTSCSQ